jgi:hypothetical protein
MQGLAAEAQATRRMFAEYRSQQQQQPIRRELAPVSAEEVQNLPESELYRRYCQAFRNGDEYWQEWFMREFRRRGKAYVEC